MACLLVYVLAGMWPAYLVCMWPTYLEYVLAGMWPAYLVYVLAGVWPAYLVCVGWHVACLLSVCWLACGLPT